MATRRFKPGDRVRHYGGGPVMQIMNYVVENRLLIGAFQSDKLVECVWYDDGNRHTKVFHQDLLINSSVRLRCLIISLVV
jgi:uncharacterized protein YodC (DUF2158 family)